MADTSSATSTHVPKDVEAIRSIFKSSGVEKYEPATVLQLLDFEHRYVKGVLEEAHQYAAHDSGRTDIRIEDVRLATQSRVNFSFTQPPPRDFLIQLATAKNQEPLEELDARPPFGAEWGRVLPKMGDEWLSAANFQVQRTGVRRGADKSKDSDASDAEDEGDEGEKASGSKAKKAKTQWGEDAGTGTGKGVGKGKGKSDGGESGVPVRPTPVGPRRGASLGGLTVQLPSGTNRGDKKEKDNEWDPPVEEEEAE